MTFFADLPEWEDMPDEVFVTDGEEGARFFALSTVLEAYREGGHIYVLCNRPDCAFHDGDGCGLDSITVKGSMCSDFEGREL